MDDYQKGQVQEVFEAQREKMEAQRAQADTTEKPSFDQMRARHEAMKKEMRQVLSAILTPEQLKKLDAFLPERGPRPMGGPPPGE